MSIPLNISTVFLGFIIAQGLFASIILWFSRKNKVSNRLLSLLLLSISLWLCDTFFSASGLYAQNSDLYFNPIYYSLAFGPLIYFYTKSLVDGDFKWHKKYYLHFIPVLIQCILYWVLTFVDYQTKYDFWFNIHKPITYKIEFDGTLISLAIYLALSIKMLFNYSKWVSNNYSETSKINLKWLKILLLLIFILTLQWLFEAILRDFFEVYFDYKFSPYLLGALAIMLGFGGILQANMSKVKFQNAVDSIIDQELDQKTLEKIKGYMDSQKPYLNPNLNLKQFSENLKLPSRIVSFHINKGLNRTFIDFVNEYRVEEVKAQLAANENETYTLLAIALDSGFNSKSSFNRIFKKHTGTPPSAFLE